MRRYTEEIKSYVLENVSPEGIFNKRYTDISHDLDIPMNAVRLAVLDITKTGFIEVLSAPTRGVNSNPIYKLKLSQVAMVDTHPVHSKDIVEFEFYGMSLHMFETEIGLILPVDELASATLSDESIIYKIIDSNKVQFENNILDIDGVMFINKLGVLAYLTKLNLSNVLPVKIEILNNFQTNIISHMAEIILKGKLVFTDHNHAKIKNNLSLLTDINKEMVESMFSDLERQIENLVNATQVANIKCKSTVDSLSKENEKLHNRVKQEASAKNNMITEIRELKNKLLDRS